MWRFDSLSNGLCARCLLIMIKTYLVTVTSFIEVNAESPEQAKREIEARQEFLGMVGPVTPESDLLRNAKINNVTLK